MAVLWAHGAELRRFESGRLCSREAARAAHQLLEVRILPTVECSSIRIRVECSSYAYFCPPSNQTQLINHLLYSSATHFCIKRQLEEGSASAYCYVIEDLSRNGTKINDELLGNGKSRALKSGDVVGIKFKTESKVMYTFSSVSAEAQEASKTNNEVAMDVDTGRQVNVEEKGTPSAPTPTSARVNDKENVAEKEKEHFFEEQDKEKEGVAQKDSTSASAAPPTLAQMAQAPPAAASAPPPCEPPQSEQFNASMFESSMQSASAENALLIKQLQVSKIRECVDRGVV